MNEEMHLVDAHCHLDLFLDFEEEAQRRQDAGLWTLAVTTLPQAWERNCEIAGRHSMVEAALGIHPELVAQYPDAVAVWKRLAEHARFIGEVGLDGRPRNRQSLPQQNGVFSTILDTCTQLGDKVLTVHSASAQKQVISLLEDRLDLERNRVVLHWFTGSRTLFAKAIELGCFFSVNLAMLERDRLVRQVQEIPRSRLITESDAPFLETNVGSVSSAEKTTRALATALGSSPESMAQQIRETLQTLLAGREGELSSAATEL